MAKRRDFFRIDFRANVALAAIRCDGTIAELAALAEELNAPRDFVHRVWQGISPKAHQVHEASHARHKHCAARGLA